MQLTYSSYTYEINFDRLGGRHTEKHYKSIFQYPTIKMGDRQKMNKEREDLNTTID